MSTTVAAKTKLFEFIYLFWNINENGWKKTFEDSCEVAKVYLIWVNA